MMEIDNYLIGKMDTLARRDGVDLKGKWFPEMCEIVAF